MDSAGITTVAVVVENFYVLGAVVSTSWVGLVFIEIFDVLPEAGVVIFRVDTAGNQNCKLARVAGKLASLVI